MSARFCSSILVLAAFVAFGNSVLGQSELIDNGDFSDGLNGWAINSLSGSNGSWFSSDVGQITPRSIKTTTSDHGAADGGYALSDQTGPGTHALTQSFVVPAGTTSAILSFDMFVNDANNAPVVDPIGLNHMGPSNQHARVDLLSDGASIYDTGAGVLRNLFLSDTPAGMPNPQPFTHYEFDLTGLVSAGGTFGLRFAETNNLSTLNMGIDNVSLQVLPTIVIPPTNPPMPPVDPPTMPPVDPPTMPPVMPPNVPEPNSLGTWLLPAIVVVLLQRRRGRRSRR